MAREILRTIPLTDLVWSGNEKKTANVPVGDEFEFYPDRLPTFTEQWPNPEEFTIYYRDEFSVMQPLTCNYVSNGATRYTFSYKLDNDVINLSVFKSDGHLEINVRNAKLEQPMNLNLVEFQVIYNEPIEEYSITISETEHGTVVADKETATAGETVTLTITPDEGYEVDSIEVKDSDDNVIATTETFNMPESDVFVTVTFKEIIPPTPVEGLRFTTTFNRYAIVDVTVKDDGSEADVDVRPLVYDTDVDLDETYETVLRSSCIFRQDLRVTVEVEMNKPDNKAENYTVKSTKVFINGEEI